MAPLFCRDTTKRTGGSEPFQHSSSQRETRPIIESQGIWAVVVARYPLYTRNSTLPGKWSPVISNTNKPDTMLKGKHPQSPFYIAIFQFPCLSDPPSKYFALPHLIISRYPLLMCEISWHKSPGNRTSGVSGWRPRVPNTWQAHARPKTLSKFLTFNFVIPLHSNSLLQFTAS
jgi:hypothetical protein